MFGSIGKNRTMSSGTQLQRRRLAIVVWTVSILGFPIAMILRRILGSSGGYPLLLFFVPE